MTSEVRSQAPRLLVAPGEYDDSWAELAGSLASSYGLTPDQWQEIVLHDWLARKGKAWASTTCGLSVPRQNGKNALLEIRELFGIVGRGEKILHTAHELRTARKAFSRLMHFFGEKANDPGARFPELNALVDKVRLVNGQEAIYLKNGGSVEVVARSKGSGRGFTVDTLVIDEAQELADEDIEALLSTTSAAPLADPQWIFTGTPPGPRSEGEGFTRIRDEALGANPGRVCWHEWSAEPHADLDDRRVWSAVNPGLSSGRMSLAVFEGERARFSDEGFGRERLGQWSVAVGTSVIPKDAWDLAADEQSLAVGDKAIAIDVSPDRSTSSVALAGRRDDGLWHFEIDETRHGVDWLAPYVLRLLTLNPDLRAVVIDARSPAAAIVDEFTREGIKVTVTQTKDMADACGQFYDAVVAGHVRHLDQPQLNFALANARKRALGDSWAWNRKSTASDITGLVACTLALWGARASSVKRPQRRSGKAVFTGAGV